MGTAQLSDIVTNNTAQPASGTAKLTDIVSNQSQSQPSESEGFWSGAKDLVTGVGTGIVRGGIGLARTASLPGAALLGKTAENEAGWQQLESELTPTSGAGKVGDFIGHTTENVAEFMAGESLLKAGVASLSAKYAALSKAHKILEEYPKLANIIGTALSSGTVGAGQALVHGESLGDAATTGAITGVIGGGVAAIAKGLSAGASAAAAQEGKLLDKPVSGEIENTLRNVATDVSKTATGEAPLGQPAKSVRGVFEDAAQQVKGKAQEFFGDIDKATVDATGRSQFTPVNNELRDISFKLRSADEATSGALLDRRALLEAKQEQLFQLAEANKVPRDTVTQARALWKQGSALDDVDHAVKMSTKGMNPDIQGPESGDFTPETVDPKMLFNRMNRLYDSGRLLEAFAHDRGHVKDIMAVLDLAQQPQTSGLFQQILTEVAKHSGFTAIGAVGGYEKGGVSGGIAGAVVGAASPMLVSKLLASPLAMHVVKWGLEKGVPASQIVPAVVNSMQLDDAPKPK